MKNRKKEKEGGEKRVIIHEKRRDDVRAHWVANPYGAKTSETTENREEKKGEKRR